MKALYDNFIKYWPVYSIAKWALRQEILCVSEKTWYKYINKLNWAKPVIKKRKFNFSGIIATAPNRIWHADVTILPTASGMKCYIYLLMDSFSRFILSWWVSDKLCKYIRYDTIKDAYDMYVDDTVDHEIMLVVDRGSENNNTVVDDYINQDMVSLHKYIAKKDILMTNNIIEAGNKMLKYRYLFRKEYQYPEDVEKDLEWMIPDYNYQRPHVSLKGATPYEAYTNKNPDFNHLQNLMIQAKQEKIKKNQIELCDICRE